MSENNNATKAGYPIPEDSTRVDEPLNLKSALRASGLLAEASHLLWRVHGAMHLGYVREAGHPMVAARLRVVKELEALRVVLADEWKDRATPEQWDFFGDLYAPTEVQRIEGDGSQHLNAMTPGYRDTIIRMHEDYDARQGQLKHRERLAKELEEWCTKPRTTKTCLIP